MKFSAALLIYLALLTSFATTMWFCSSQFEPQIVYLSDTFDAFRYHVFASRASAVPFDELGDIWIPFESPGYAVFLAAAYRLLGANAFIGCAVNWGMWILSGWLIAGAIRPHVRDVTGFLVLWILYPDLLYWCGMTTKEPLCVLLLSISSRVVLSNAGWSRVVPCLAACVLAAAYVRPVLAAPIFTMALARRYFRQSSKLYGALPALGVCLALFALYVAGGDGSGSINPLALAGADRVEADATFRHNLSHSSVLARIGSSNRLVDSGAAIVRGIANVITPVFVSPLDLPLVATNETSFALWVAGAITSLCIMMSTLAFVDIVRGKRQLTLETVVLRAATIVSIVALGLSGVIHERYRSITVPMLIPLAFCDFHNEREQHGGIWRVAIFAAFTVALAGLGYALLKL